MWRGFTIGRTAAGDAMIETMTRRIVLQGVVAEGLTAADFHFAARAEALADPAVTDFLNGWEYA